MPELDDALNRAQDVIASVPQSAVKQALIALHDAITALADLQEPELPELPEASDGE